MAVNGTTPHYVSAGACAGTTGSPIPGGASPGAQAINPSDVRDSWWRVN
jgi:hypothetical protein